MPACAASACYQVRPCCLLQCTIMDPAHSDKMDGYVEMLVEKRKKKHLTPDQVPQMPNVCDPTAVAHNTASMAVDICQQTTADAHMLCLNFGCQCLHSQAA